MRSNSPSVDVFVFPVNINWIKIVHKFISLLGSHPLETEVTSVLHFSFPVGFTVDLSRPKGPQTGVVRLTSEGISGAGTKDCQGRVKGGHRP